MSIVIDSWNDSIGNEVCSTNWEMIRFRRHTVLCTAHRIVDSPLEASEHVFPKIYGTSRFGTR